MACEWLLMRSTDSAASSHWNWGNIKRPNFRICDCEVMVAGWVLLCACEMNGLSEYQEET